MSKFILDESAVKNIREAINARACMKIRAANEEADKLLTAFEFLQKELNEGAELQTAINTTCDCYPELQNTLADIFEEVIH